MSQPKRRMRPGRAKAPVGLAPRLAAADLLAAILHEGRALEALLDADGGVATFLSLPPRERALARAIAAAALRHHGEIDAVLAEVMDRPPRRSAGALPTILRVAAAQMLFLDVPDHAAVSLALAAAERDPGARHYKALANGVLRRIGRERDMLTADLDAARLNTPDWLWRRWSDFYGEATARRIAEAHLVPPSLDLTVKAEPALWAERLGGIVLPTGSVRLDQAGAVEDLAGYDEGAWWVQDAAAALPARLFGDLAGKRAADLCAAPGGKTAQLALAGAHVVAVDRAATRLHRLAANLERLGLTAETVCADARDWSPGQLFDAVLVDAPCLSTGTIRRHPDLPLAKREGDIVELARLQWQLLERAAALTAPGGMVVYCVCSLEREEGEDQAARTLAELPFELVPVESEEVGGLAEICRSDGTLRSLPCHLAGPEPRFSGMDGFFAARFRRQ